MFNPFLGEMMQFEEHSFQMGCSTTRIHVPGVRDCSRPQGKEKKVVQPPTLKWVNVDRIHVYLSLRNINWQPFLGLVHRQEYNFERLAL